MAGLQPTDSKMELQLCFFPAAMVVLFCLASPATSEAPAATQQHSALSSRRPPTTETLSSSTDAPTLTPYRHTDAPDHQHNSSSAPPPDHRTSSASQGHGRAEKKRKERKQEVKEEDGDDVKNKSGAATKELGIDFISFFLIVSHAYLHANKYGSITIVLLQAMLCSQIFYLLQCCKSLNTLQMYFVRLTSCYIHGFMVYLHFMVEICNYKRLLKQVTKKKRKKLRKKEMK